MKIEFDPKKAASNLKKHGVSFDEAASCLLAHWRWCAMTLMQEARCVWCYWG